MRWIWIDKFTEFTPRTSATAVKNVTLAEEHLHDLYPLFPIVPHSLIIEGMAQTAGVICMLMLGRDGASAAPYFLTIDKAKFRKPVFPGDTVEYHMAKTARRKNMWWYRGEAKVAGQIVAEAEVGAIINNI